MAEPVLDDDNPVIVVARSIEVTPEPPDDGPTETGGDVDAIAIGLATRFTPGVSAPPPDDPDQHNNHWYAYATAVPRGVQTTELYLDNTADIYAVDEILPPGVDSLSGIRAVWLKVVPRYSGWMVVAGAPTAGLYGTTLTVLRPGPTWTVLSHQESQHGDSVVWSQEVVADQEIYLRFGAGPGPGQTVQLQIVQPLPWDATIDSPTITLAAGGTDLKPSEPAVKADSIGVGVTATAHIRGEFALAEAPAIDLAITTPDADDTPPPSGGDVEVPPIGLTVEVSATAAEATIVMTQPDPDEVVRTQRPEFVVALDQEDESLVYTIEIQYADDAAFTDPVTLSVDSETADAGARLVATTDVTTPAWWRARLLLGGNVEIDWLPAHRFEVDTSTTGTTAEVTWTVSPDAERPIHLWHFDPPGPEAGDLVTVYGQGFPFSGGTLTLDDEELTVESWTLVEAPDPVPEARVIDGTTVDCEHFAVTFVAPSVDSPGAPVTVESPSGSPPSQAAQVPPRSRFLVITSPPINASAGWQIRVLDYKDMKTLVAIVNEFESFSFTQQLNDPGAGSLSIDTDSPWWNSTLNNGLSARSILDNEYVFEAWENGRRVFAWLGEVVDNAIIGEDETRTTVISGPGIAKTLNWAKIMRPGWPKKPSITGYTKEKKKQAIRRAHSYNDNLPAYNWRFPVKWPTMRMWYTTLRAAQRRGLCRFVTPMFTATRDSAKKKWEWVQTQTEIVANEGYEPEEPGESLLDFLNDCTGQDYSKWFGQRLEWIMYPGFKLDVRTKIGTDRSRYVRFYVGQIISSQRTRDRDEIANRVTAVDVDGTETVRTDANSVRAWNLRELRNDAHKNITNATLRGYLADKYLEISRGEKNQWDIRIPYDDAWRVPFRNFFVGDWIGVVTGTTSSIGVTQKYRVLSISLSLNSEQSVPDVELTLQSVIDARMQALEKKITEIINKPRNYKISELKDVKIPENPDVKSGLVYDPDTGTWGVSPVSDWTTGGTPGGPTAPNGPRVYMMANNPANQYTVRPGDFWLETYD